MDFQVEICTRAGSNVKRSEANNWDLWAQLFYIYNYITCTYLSVMLSRPQGASHVFKMVSLAVHGSCPRARGTERDRMSLLHPFIKCGLLHAQLQVWLTTASRVVECAQLLRWHSQEAIRMHTNRLCHYENMPIIVKKGAGKPENHEQRYNNN
jgi:hypothetical protein